ncbi:MAG: nitrogen fixation protein FixH [Rhodoferax sp.]|uniref:FixH family protein n=1 Tax=Rhodoferax sp. TaxID=50421 RepID=UPI0017EFE6D7|nr:FixH family protein [Rhodoferax sp.]NMM15359.1 nitrogen fixation protein FixH [Rhodoferax sp.]NMM21073.1 nitrogen fixation protein FixH [Rhodoferax sp.]
MQKDTVDSGAPWWKFGHVWMVFGGPAIVVVASFITLYLAVTRPDPVVSEDYYQKGIDINQTLDAANAASLAPALQARNHAATGVQPTAKAVNKP